MIDFFTSLHISFFCHLLLAAALPASAQIELPYLFSSHMVLQRDVPVRVWGKAAAGERVKISFHQQTKTTKADRAGNWALWLDSESAGGPYELKIEAGDTAVRFTDVLVGEVWVCSGQSNMEWTVAEAKNAQEEMAAADFPTIRQFDVPNRVAFSPQANTAQSEWIVCHPKTAGKFSAVAYFFARKLTNELGVPVGLINSTWGGTVAEAWTSINALKTHPDFTAAIQLAPKSEEEYATIMQKRNEELIRKFQGRISSTDESKWQTDAFKDEAWPTLRIDKLWEEQGLPSFDGAVFYRTKIKLTAEESRSDATILLGTIDDDDSTFVNGRFVGTTSLWNAERRYVLPKNLLRPNVNTIVVRVADNQGGGGFYGNGEKELRFSNGNIFPLPLEWKAQISANGTVQPLTPNELHASLYNGMIHPLTNYTIRGVIWYQGESNADRAAQYETLFPLLITDWRNRWRQNIFPFYFVQLSSYDPQHRPAGSPSNWAELREAQRKTLSLPNTGMAVTIDVGERDDIHPKNKQDVGLRLALLALNKTYGKKLQASGPTFKGAKKPNESIVVEFSDTGSGLITTDGSTDVKTMEVLDAKGTVQQVEATLSGNTVLVQIPAGVQPVALRYAWRDDAGAANLKNKEGLPAVPFRFDLTNAKEFSIKTKTLRQ